ncbi:MAG: hypothetical protein EZS28_002829 [Streblomastix strix]|uniref:Protein kinase domain-containing protein n=1 Tax=Streblomastix strix TaxID=222440 RepID=A0A5J4X4H9_9EUKA|nr:MAG: hypothetical protein EZS28_002829 [Streblomastix strix]
MTKLNCIVRNAEIKDDILWDLLSQMLEFDPEIRITAAEALQHPYFTSPEALCDISQEQRDLSQLAAKAEKKGDATVTEFDKDPTFIVVESIIQQFILEEIRQNQQKEQIQHDNDKMNEELKYGNEGFQSVFKEKEYDKYPLNENINSAEIAEQLQAERDLLEQNMTLEEIKQKFENYEELSLLDIDVICRRNTELDAEMSQL